MDGEANKKDYLDMINQLSISCFEKTGKTQIMMTNAMRDHLTELYGEGCGYDLNKVDIHIYPLFK